MLPLLEGVTNALVHGRSWIGHPVRANDCPGALSVPTQAAELARHYDLTLSHPSGTRHAFRAFEGWLAQAAASRGISVAVLQDAVVEETTCRLDRGELTIGLHLDYFALWHVADDPYARLAQAVQDSGGCPINVPARSRLFTDKAAAHAELQRRGCGVPATVILRPWQPDRPLIAAEARQLGTDDPACSLYLKPANGFGSKGVVRLERPEPAKFPSTLTAARNYDRTDSLLIQREVRYGRLRCDDGVDRPAYWRLWYCLGEIIPFWWSKQELECGRPSYRRATSGEMKLHRLGSLWAFVQQLAELSGLHWFSTEICLSEGRERSRFTVPGADGQVRPLVAIDYFNDQCDVNVQSRWLGAPPDAVVQHVAERFVETAYRQQQGLLSLHEDMSGRLTA
jgi:hypothetical protein